MYYPSSISCIIVHSESHRFWISESICDPWWSWEPIFTYLFVFAHTEKLRGKELSFLLGKHSTIVFARTANKQTCVPWCKSLCHSRWLHSPCSLVPSTPLSPPLSPLLCVKNRLFAWLKRYSQINSGTASSPPDSGSRIWLRMPQSPKLTYLLANSR